MANFATQSQIDREIAGILGVKRGRTEGGRLTSFGTATRDLSVGAESLVGLSIKWSGSKDFSMLALESAEYMQYSSNRMAREIRARTISGRLPSRHRTSSVSKRYAAYKVKHGARPMRDSVLTGQMWRGWGPKRKKGSTTATLGFGGNHRALGMDEREVYVPERGKYKGQTSERNLTNQRIANRWALRARSGAPHPESYSGRPFHCFTEADDIQKVWYRREYEIRVLKKGLDELPPIKGMGERTARGQVRKFSRIQPRSAR